MHIKGVCINWAEETNRQEFRMDENGNFSKSRKIRRISSEMKKQYGTKVYRISLSSGCTCPNRDGTVGTGGCTFCSAGGSGDFAASGIDIDVQLEKAKQRIREKMPSSIPESEWKYIAYFQSYSNTYGDLERLRQLYENVIRRPEIAVLSIGTRPDCLGPAVMDMLTDLNRIKPVWIELGLQTMHERTAEKINRGYTLPVFEDAYGCLKKASLDVIVHVILGLPGESRDDMLDTIRYLARLNPPPDGIKLQLLHVLRGTELGRQYERKPFPLLGCEEYCDLVVDCLKLLPEKTVVHRMTGDGPRKLLIGPKWSMDKKRVLNLLNKKIREAGME